MTYPELRSYLIKAGFTLIDPDPDIPIFEYTYEDGCTIDVEVAVDVYYQSIITLYGTNGKALNSVIIYDGSGDYDALTDDYKENFNKIVEYLESD